MRPGAGSRDEVLAEVFVEAARDAEETMAREGKVPDVRRLAVRRLVPVVEFAWALALALNVASMALLLNFLVFAKTLHFAF